MIFLSPRSNKPGDFWHSWPPEDAEFSVPDTIAPDDVVIHDVRLGQPEHPSQTIGLLLSNDHLSGGSDPNALARIAIGLRTCARIVVPSSDIFWPNSTVLPLGVDTDLFRPRSNIAELRTLYGLPTHYPVGFWRGDLRYNCGYDNLMRYISRNPGTHWVLVFDQLCYPTRLPCHRTIYYDVSQNTMADLMGCADFGLKTARTEGTTTTDIEAMASGLGLISVRLPNKDTPPSNFTREDVIRYGWDCAQAMRRWRKYVEEFRECLQRKA
jgi:hypothetical protein